MGVGAPHCPAGVCDPIGIKLRHGRLEIAPVGAEQRSAPGRPPARTAASTPVDAWPQTPEVRLESLRVYEPPHRPALSQVDRWLRYLTKGGDWYKIPVACLKLSAEI